MIGKKGGKRDDALETTVESDDEARGVLSEWERRGRPDVRVNENTGRGLYGRGPVLTGDSALAKGSPVGPIYVGSNARTKRMSTG